MRLLNLVALIALLVPTTAFAGHRHARHRDRDRREQVGYQEPAPDPNTYGSIAWSASTNKIGWSSGYATPEAAEAAAVSACGVGDCAWQVMEGSQYAVLSVGTGGPAVAWNADFNTAYADALAACSAKGENCGLNAWVYK